MDKYRACNEILSILSSYSSYRLKKSILSVISLGKNFLKVELEKFLSFLVAITEK